MGARTPIPEVWKFGGASLADAQAIQRAVTLVAGERGALVVVASALGGVTDLLLEGARAAATGGRADAARTAAEFLRRHRAAVRALLPPGGPRRQLLAKVDASAREYRDVCAAVSVLGHMEPRASDTLVSRGERLSAAIVAAALGRAGRRAVYVDATEVIATDLHYGEAAPDLAETTRLARRRLGALLRDGTVAVVPGYIGRAPDGSVTTLGRGGSDLTATLLGRALGARRVVLWKDVPGILTADPRVVPDARLIPELHHREAAEVAYYGAKVLHPRALIPLAGTRILLRVRSFVDTTAAGTDVSARRPTRRHPVKALATVHDQAIVTVSGKGMVGVHGIAARTFAAVEAARLSVSTIFQASSESSIGFTIPQVEADRAVAGLRHAFREELQKGLIDTVTASSGKAVIAVVGDGMAGTPGVAARVFSSLASSNINVVAIAQGSSERNISLVVDAADAPKAARQIHAAFQLSKIGGGEPRRVSGPDVVLLGFGRVGRALAEQIVASNREEVRLVGLVDASGYIFEPRGLSRRRLRDLARRKSEGLSLARQGGQPGSAVEALAVMASHAVSRPVVADVTAGETSQVLLGALGHGFDVVLANKKPLAGTMKSYAALVAAASASGRRIRYEATVGAGLPIIDTYQKLVQTGDRVLRVEGCVSGTLMHVLSEVSLGRRFSAAVRDAVALGYAEPDPREDLSGRDAARKALILARLLGYRGPMPVADDLVPPSLERLSPGAFMDRLPSVDAAWAARVARAAARQQVLRYVVTATSRGVSARLTTVAAASPMGALQRTQNLVAFTTTRYRTEPLVVSGPGAGPAVTAAGILNDIHSLSGS